jgi:hypothetical protein
MATLSLTVGAAALTQGMSLWAALGIKAAAGVAGSLIDQQLLGPSPVAQQGPRLDNLQVQASTEGAALPEIAGRARLAGQIIWATKFKEVAKTEQTGGKGMGPKVQTTSYSYFVNFAVGLCEGPIDRVARIWADGKPLDMTNIVMRLYPGTADQLPDPFIEAIEGTGIAPAYRGTAYVVFENFALEKFGNRIPQLNFEVFRRVSPLDGSGVEDLVQTISIIPGGGERVYDTIVTPATPAGERPPRRTSSQDGRRPTGASRSMIFKRSCLM